ALIDKNTAFIEQSMTGTETIPKVIDMLGVKRATMTSDAMDYKSAATGERPQIHFMTPEGKNIAFLTNDMELSVGLVAFFYLGRWDIHKCFDN
ncbi:MAG: hypothetical protein P8176_15255, partial [Gammaproteobacteria bacterium]